MEPIVESCAGLDVHQKSVVACVLWGPLDSKPRAELRKFGTTTGELLELADWLAERRAEVVGMESTGVFWKPVWNVFRLPLSVSSPASLVGAGAPPAMLLRHVLRPSVLPGPLLAGPPADSPPVRTQAAG